MNSKSETRISLENFQRHFVLTHERNEAIALLNELQQQADASGQSFANVIAAWLSRKYPQSAYQDDNWYVRDVSFDECYFAHTDFRLHPVPKDHRFVDYLPSQRQAIESGSFPCSVEIRAPWSGQMPEPLIQERGSEKYYVLDGQCRVIRHWYHSVPNVRVFIYRGQLAV
jgi:hypothetical protein